MARASDPAGPARLARGSLALGAARARAALLLTLGLGLAGAAGAPGPRGALLPLLAVQVALASAGAGAGAVLPGREPARAAGPRLDIRVILELRSITGTAENTRAGIQYSGRGGEEC